MKQQRELSVPQEIKDLFDDVYSINICRDEAIKSFFKAKRAIFYAKESLKLNRKAWSMVNDLYPETKEGKWIYSNSKQVLVENSNA